MTDEVGADHSHVSRGDELIAELVRAALYLLDALLACDATLEEHPRDAVHRAQTDMFNFVIRAGLLRRDLGLAPPNSHLPGDAVARSVRAFADLNRGIVDPVLKPPEEPEELETKRGRHELSLHARNERVRPAVLMELLIMDGYGVKKAAREVADRTGDSAGTIERRWRAIKKGGPDFYSWDTECFNNNVADMKHLVGERGGTAADYIKFADAVLGSSAKKRRKRPQKRTPG